MISERKVSPTAKATVEKTWWNCRKKKKRKPNLGLFRLGFQDFETGVLGLRAWIPGFRDWIPGFRSFESETSGRIRNSGLASGTSMWDSKTCGLESETWKTGWTPGRLRRNSEAARLDSGTSELHSETSRLDSGTSGLNSKTSRLGVWNFGPGFRDFETAFQDFGGLNARLQAGFEIRGWIPGLRGGIPRLVGWNPRLGDEFRDLVSGFQVRRLKRQLKTHFGTVEKKKERKLILEFFGLGFQDFET